jgi:signal transduction histidine kinase
MNITSDVAGPQWNSVQPPQEITGRLFNWGRDITRTHPLATDTLLAAVLLTLSTVWLAGSVFATPQNVVLQTALVLTVAARRVWPLGVFAVACAIAFGQWLLGVPLFGDTALLVGLYTVAAHQSRLRAGLAALALEVGVFMAALKWEPAGTVPRSLLFLTATVVAALFSGLAVASGSRYLAWMDERARRLAVERDQQAVIAAASERTRIARELHDIVSHSLSVVITLADAAAVVSQPGPGQEAMADVSEAGRQALSDMRAMLGVLRTDEPPADLTPQPGLDQLGGLVERVRATGLAVDLGVEGTPFPLSAAAGLSVYRIVQEALTNTIRHANARQARVTIGYDAPWVSVAVTDDGRGAPVVAGARTLPEPGRPGLGGHGIEGMRERAALHDGTVTAGPGPGGGWRVQAALRLGTAPA